MNNVRIIVDKICYDGKIRVLWALALAYVAGIIGEFLCVLPTLKYGLEYALYLSQEEYYDMSRPGEYTQSEVPAPQEENVSEPS